MNTYTYRQAFDKITEAYIKGEIKPYDPHFCFCGTLCNNQRQWVKCSWAAVYKGEPHNDFGQYTGIDYANMERAMLTNLRGEDGSKRYEEALFAGMSAALDVLRQIHIEKGEIIDEVPEFVKRQLVHN